MAEPTTQTLGRYRTLAELGRGGFASVYRALDTKLGREVALKVLKPGWTDDPRAVERFMREATQSAALRHPNIATVYDVDQVEGRLFIAMELVPGRSLQRVVAEDGPLTWERTILILEQAAAALDHAHKRGLVHRDVKPANIILDESESGHSVRAVLTDFGLVRSAEQASLTLGSTGGVVGTPEYIAPELWDGQNATPASDVYALACVGYYMLAGQALFAGTTPMAVIRRHMDGAVLPRQWPVGVPDSVTSALQKALARDPAQRTPTAGQLIADLRCQEEQSVRHIEQTAQAEAARKEREAQELLRARQAAEEAERQKREQAARRARVEQEEREKKERLAREVAQQEERRRQAQLTAAQPAPALPQQPQELVAPKVKAQSEWKLWLLWVGATTIGGIVGSLAAPALLSLLFASSHIYSSPDVVRIVFPMVDSLIAASAVGTAQWLVLRHYIPKAGLWIIATVIGTAGSVIVFGMGGPGFIVQVVILIPLGRTVIGLAQWLVLRNYLRQAGWWIPAAVVGFIPRQIYLFLLDSGILRGSVGYSWLGLGTDIILGAITGAVLVRLLRSDRVKK